MSVTKKSPVRSINDLRPVTLTPAVIKVFRKVVLVHFQVLVTDFLDPWQFAHGRNRSVEKKRQFVSQDESLECDPDATILNPDFLSSTVLDASIAKISDTMATGSLKEEL